VKFKLLSDGPIRSYAVIFQTGDEAMSGLLEFAHAAGIGAAQITAIGACERLTLAYFDWESKSYQAFEVEEQVEVLSFIGDITLKGDDRQVHVHCVASRRDGSTLGGHVMEARVRPTLEVFVNEPQGRLQRSEDTESTLHLIDPDL
jgi:predicted DNA-binding protein with PD1-like motif